MALSARGGEQGLSHCANTRGAQSPALCSDKEKCYTAKRMQKCKRGEHPKVPKRVLSHQESTVNLANKFILYQNTVFPNVFGSQITASCFDHHILSANFNGSFYVSINSLAQPPRPVKISGLQPSNWFSKRNLQPLLPQRLFLHASRSDNYEVGQGAIHPAYGNQAPKRNSQEKKAVSFHLTDHSTYNAKNNLLFTPDFYQTGRFGCRVKKAIGTEGWLPDLKV